MLQDEEQFRRALADIGEEAVRRNLSRGVYNEQKVAAAELWLGEREAGRQAVANQGALNIAKSSKDAAWVAAIAAVVASIVSVVALVVSLTH